MAGINPKYTDRGREGKKMKGRLIRLTEDENEMLDELIQATGLTMRDLIVKLLDEKYREEFERY